MSLSRRASLAVFSKPTTSLLRSTVQRPLAQQWQQVVVHTRSSLPARTFSALQSFRQQAAAAVQQDAGEGDAPSDARHFQDLREKGLVSPLIVDTITKRMGLTTMTDVQALTIEDCLDGKDVIAQARTGTGKTLAFLVPIIQNIINQDPTLGNPRGRIVPRATTNNIRAIIISPTRELAEQIATEARKVSNNTNILIQCAVGGTQKSLNLRQMRQEGCHILVGTPGRIHDLLSDPYSNVRAPNLSALVYDEADRLLDAGFAPQLDEILRHLPDTSKVARQTLMFSATVPKEVMQLVRAALRPDFKFIQTVNENEEPTHVRVPQKVIYARGLENLVPTLLELCARESRSTQETRPFKAIVFYNTTADVALAAAILQRVQYRRSRRNEASAEEPLLPHDVRVIETHGRLTQQQRTRASEDFRRAKSAMLLSSDVTARGMDFPGVTHVIQVGLPSSRDAYIHRLGRTGRAGKEGQGFIIVSEVEAHDFSSKLRRLPIKEERDLDTAQTDLTKSPEAWSEKATKVVEAMREGTNNVDPSMMKDSYMSQFGILKGSVHNQDLVNALNHLAMHGWGMREPPPVARGFVAKLGLEHCQGLNMSGGGYRSAIGPDGSPVETSFAGGRSDSRGDRNGFRDRGSSMRTNPFGNSREQSRGRGGFGGRGQQRNSRSY